MHIIIHTDGGSLYNPGPAACAFVAKTHNKHLFQDSFFLGTQTNNFAEYSGVIKALEWALSFKVQNPLSSLSFMCDSLLLVNQLNGLYKIKNPTIREFVFKIRTLEQEINIPVRYTHVLRELNQEADALVKKELLPHHHS